MRIKELRIRDIRLRLPSYFPDATRGVVRGLDSRDLIEAGISGIVVNTWHLMDSPGATAVEAAGGIRKFMGWPGVVASDSGGFQLLSLVHRDRSAGEVTAEGVTYVRRSGGAGKKHLFTPEKSVAAQFALGSDIMFCLDDCPSPGAGAKENAASVERTVDWATRCRKEYDRQAAERKLAEGDRPLLFAVIQGGDDPGLRHECARALVATGFDGYGFGGWPMDKNGKMKTEILELTAGLMPADRPRFALGVGSPSELGECRRMGYDLFDCVLPTRDARHKRLYVLDPDGKGSINIGDEKYTRDGRPVSAVCSCRLCKGYTRAYLSHLFRIEDSAAWRLATIHNLVTYAAIVRGLE